MPFVERDCLTCGEHFKAWEYPNRTPRRYCSKQCWLTSSVHRQNVSGRLRDSGLELTYRKKGEKREHRVIMEEKLGRPLLPTELVHHIDEDIRNNDPGNLEIKTRPQHQSEHMKTWWRRWHKENG